MLFAQMFDIINAGIVVLDRDLKIIKWNRWMETHSRITTEEIIGKSILTYFPSLDTSWFLRGCKAVFTFGNFAFFSQKIHQYCFPFKTDETFQATFEYMQQNCTMGPIRREDNTVEYVYIMVQDVTDLVAATLNLMKATEEAKKLADEANAANRAKGDFIANMSHEIRTPMNAIIGFTELLAGRIEDDQLKGYLSGISASGNTLLKLINDILDLSKIEAGMLKLEYEPINPYSVFNEIGQMFSPRCMEKDVDFRMEIDHLLPKGLLLDGIRFRQILINLVSNAVKFTESGYVKLSISVDRINEENGTLDFHFSVEDTGIGIAEDQKKLIYDPFIQQDGQKTAEYGGTGLGLSITNQLVEMMDGTITESGKAGKGAIFSVAFKGITITSDIETMEAQDETLDAIEFERATILIVDDNPLNRALLKEFIEFYGMNIIEAGNGREAIELTRLYHPDLIMMDLKMPVMDGYEASKKLKADDKLKDIPIVVVTATAMKEEEEMLLNMGCASVLWKPVNRIMLVNELMNHLPYQSDKTAMADSARGLKVSAISLTADVKSRLPELTNILENELMDKWNRVHKSFFVDEIEDFAKEVRELGEEYNFDVFSDWSNRLFKQVASFDMEKLPGTLGYYPELVKEITELNEILIS